MPKRTRQEKILAQLRRMRDQTETKSPLNNSNELTPTENQNTSPSYELKSLGKPVKSTSVAVISLVEDYSYVYKDLKKTVFFAFGAILFEIILSLTASTGYAKLFFRLF